jgi:hypothetical protein
LVVLSRFEEALAGIYCKFRERKLEDVVKPMAEEYSCRAGEKEFCMGIKTVFEKYNVKE